MTRARYALAAAAIAVMATPAAAQKGVAPAATHLPAGVLALACAPQVTTVAPTAPLRVRGGQDSFTRRNYQPGELVTINGGHQNGIEIGQVYFVRRLQEQNNDTVSAKTPAIISTVGWVKVYAIDDELPMALATVEHACDTIEVGDYLEPFALPVVPLPDKDKPKAERNNYARVIRGVDNREALGKGDFFTIDRGERKGVHPGAQFVVYRDKHADGNFLYELGEAVAVRVTPDTATLQVTLSRDSIESGDYVAQRKPATN